MKISKTVTAAKAAANRRNAQTSTGPKSTQGKFFASRNSIRHGILTHDLLLPSALSVERETELNELRKELIASCEAVGSLELAQVEIMLSSLWRLRRLYRAEAGEITTRLSQCNPKVEILTSDHSGPYFQAVADLSKIEKVEEEINLHANVSAEDLDWLRQPPYGEPVQLFVRMVTLWKSVKGGEDGGTSQETPSVTEARKAASPKSAVTSQEEDDLVRPLLLNGLGRLKDAVIQEQVYHSDYLPAQLTAKRNALQVPQEAALNCLTRYENHLLRHFYRAQHALERMKRIRSGDKVPPPSASTN